MYDQIIAAVQETNESVASIIQQMLVAYIAANVFIVLFLWIPYIQKKKAAVFLYVLIDIDEENSVTAGPYSDRNYCSG